METKEQIINSSIFFRELNRNTTQKLLFQSRPHLTTKELQEKIKKVIKETSEEEREEIYNIINTKYYGKEHG